MQPPVCHSCRTPTPAPVRSNCAPCGEPLKAAVIPLTQVVAATVLRGPRLAGRLPDGRVGDFDLAEKNTLGRHANNTLRLVDREVSKEHASIERMPAGGFLLRDLGSSNGTFVNGRRVKELNLREGDEISLGNSRLVFHEGQRGRANPPNATASASHQPLPALLAQL